MGFLLSVSPTLVQVFDKINWGVVILAGLCMALPMVYWVSMIIPQKKYPEAKVKHKFIVVSCARNERDGIPHLIQSVRAQNYPRELLSVMVIAHNCSDDTAIAAREAGAEYVFELNDDDPKRKKKGYALSFAFDKILKEMPEYEAIIVMDADNLMAPDFVARMNDALDYGVEVGTGFRNSKNLDDNCIAGSNGMGLLRDCRANGHGRTLFHSTTPIAGTGFFIKRETAEDMGGWTAFNLVEDLEYSLQLLDKKHTIKYVSKAEFFDEQPHGLKYSLVRQTRLGKGDFQLLFKYGPKMLFRFFTRFWFGYLDMFLALLFPLLALVATFWFPFYYIFKAVLAFADPAASGVALAVNPNALEQFFYYDLCGENLGLFFILWGVLYQIVVYVIGIITIQNIVLLLAERKRLNYHKWYRVVTMLILYPWYNVLVPVAMTIGILTPNLVWRPTLHDRPMTLDDISSKFESKKTNRKKA